MAVLYLHVKNYLYKYGLNLIGKRDKRFNVILLVEDLRCWLRFRYIYKALNNVDCFSVRIVVAPTLDPRVSEDKDIKASAILESLAKDGVEGELAYLKGEYTDLKKFNPDIVFLIYPYDCLRCDTYNSKYVAQFATIFYINYGFMLSNFKNLHYENDFFDSCSRMYLESYDQFKNYVNIKGARWAYKRCVVAGQPQLDAFTKQSVDDLNEYWPRNRKAQIKRVLIAPHWTFKADQSDGTTINLYSTFFIFKNLYQKLPTLYPEVDFVLRAHPLMFNNILEAGLMSAQEIDLFKITFTSYINAKIDEDYEDYIKAFVSSDALITDGVSFLGEYLLSKKPIIQTVALNSIGFNEYGEKISSSNYKATNKDELLGHIEEVVLKNNDYLYSARKDVIDNQIVFPRIGISNFIVNDLKNFMLNRAQYD